MAHYNELRKLIIIFRGSGCTGIGIEGRGRDGVGKEGIDRKDLGREGAGLGTRDGGRNDRAWLDMVYEGIVTGRGGGGLENPDQVRHRFG